MRLSSERKTYEADLPRPYVLYPQGAFIVFSSLENMEDMVLCSCMRGAVQNYLELRHRAHPEESSLDRWNFPPTFVKAVEQKRSQTYEDIRGLIQVLKFEEKVCHRCQNEKPQLEFCPKSEGTVFRQQYGWYLDMKHYEYGVVPRVLRYLPEQVEGQLEKLLAYSYVSLGDALMFDQYIEEFSLLGIEEWLDSHDKIWREGDPRIWDPQYPYNFIQALKKELNRRSTSVRRYIEDVVRAEFHFAPLIEKWKSEYALYKIVRKLVPQTKIKQHFRSHKLQGLELDIYLPDYALGIEYQGIQHYEPIAFFGGKTGLAKVIARDEKKRELCEEQEITLVYFHHYETLTEDIVYRKLKPYIVDIRTPKG